MSDNTCGHRAMLSRRSFLFLGGGALLTVAVSGVAGAEGLSLQMAPYPRRKVGRLSALKAGQPVAFQYPFKHPNCTNYLYLLSAPAGGGIGPGRDVVAFNSMCPHQGGPLDGKLQARHQVLGPCPLHLSTFDLTRHGMVVSGHATESLPQVVLELQGDDIYATGVMGLVYGFHHNQARPTA